jgi:hypothetical protein
MNPDIIDNLIDNLDPDYKVLLFGEFFEEVLEIFVKDLGVESGKTEDVSYLLTLYFIFILSKYDLIETLSSELALPARDVSEAVFRMLDNLSPDLVDSIENTYREGINDPNMLYQLDYLENLSQNEIVAYLEKKSSLISVPIAEHQPSPHVAKLYNENTGDLNITDEIAAVEQEIETLQGLRTMKADMRAVQPQAEIIHTASSQADILARPPQAPGNVRSDGPRWDTEV